MWPYFTTGHSLLDPAVGVCQEDFLGFYKPSIRPKKKKKRFLIPEILKIRQAARDFFFLNFFLRCSCMGVDIS